MFGTFQDDYNIEFDLSTELFCISAYKEPTIESAEAVKVVDRATPKTGCNGYPFSRMKPISD